MQKVFSNFLRMIVALKGMVLFLYIFMVLKKILKFKILEKSWKKG